ncbi:MAG: 30S ribosome-binding factor RbfA [Dehalococcoidia bacterium]|nr:30S ribosome-binding factor RbfA [Dehalococcoidia bacterium]
MTYRLERLNSQLRLEISDLIQHYIKDPRLGNLVSVTAVEISADLRHAKVHISQLGTEQEKKETIEALTSAAGYIRHELGNRMQARRIPEFSFHLDETIEKADRILRLMDKMSEEETSQP